MVQMVLTNNKNSFKNLKLVLEFSIISIFPIGLFPMCRSHGVILRIISFFILFHQLGALVKIEVVLT